MSPHGDLWIPIVGGVATKDELRPRPLNVGEFGADAPAGLPPPPPPFCTSKLPDPRRAVDAGVAVGWSRPGVMSQRETGCEIVARRVIGLCGVAR